MIGNDFELESKELVLPFQQGFNYHKGLAFECPVVLLSVTQLLGHKPCGAVACPSIVSLPIQCADPI